jgi:hypothetical protein
VTLAEPAVEGADHSAQGVESIRAAMQVRQDDVERKRIPDLADRIDLAREAPERARIPIADAELLCPKSAYAPSRFSADSGRVKPLRVD